MNIKSDDYLGYDCYLSDNLYIVDQDENNLIKLRAQEFSVLRILLDKQGELVSESEIEKSDGAESVI